MRVPTAPVAATGLIGGYAAGRYLHRREVAGVASAMALAWCVREWLRAGVVPTVALAGLYVGGLGASHPLAKKIGPWPSVLSVAGATAGAAYALADRRNS